VRAGIGLVLSCFKKDAQGSSLTGWAALAHSRIRCDAKVAGLTNASHLSLHGTCQEEMNNCKSTWANAGKLWPMG
jgi:hypothetical protein